MDKQDGEIILSDPPYIDLSFEVGQFMVRGQLLRRWYGDAQLPIRFAVQLVGADEARP